MALTEKQKGVLRGIVPAVFLTLAAFGIAFWLSSDAEPAMAPGARLAFALRFDIAVVACLAVAIAALARHRFFTPEDIDGDGLSNPTSRAKVLQANLQNTLDQSVLAVATHLIFASVAPPGYLNLIPAAVGLFVIGRALFWRGYASGAPGRALGFGLTFYPSVILIAVALMGLILGW